MPSQYERFGKSHYENNRQYYKDKARARDFLLRDWYNKLKSENCTDCGKKYDPVCMQYDHLPNFEKSFNISSAVTRGLSKERILSEIKKCELVCANCHFIRTYKSGR